MFVVIPKISEDKQKYYESLTHEIVGDVCGTSDEEHLEGVLDDVPFVLDAERVQTCCVSFDCPGMTELRGYVKFTDDGMVHHVEFDEGGYYYTNSRPAKNAS